MFLIHDSNNSKKQLWVAVEDFGHGKVWEFYGHGLTKGGDAVTFPSLAMACDRMAIDPAPILAKAPTLANEGPAQ